MGRPTKQPVDPRTAAVLNNKGVVPRYHAFFIGTRGRA